jgi:hypothetical protein
MSLRDNHSDYRQSYKEIGIKRGLIMATLTDEEYADAEYRKFLKEKDKYVDFDKFCREEEI